jgi:large conductance mechanosensitive channel
MLKEFRDFISRGNVIDLAVAVILGAAFTAIVNSLVKDVIMPLIGIITGGLNFQGWFVTVGEAHLLMGNFIAAIINFLLIAVVLFLIVRSFNRMKKQEPPAPPPGPSAEEKLLAEIRDLLKARV